MIEVDGKNICQFSPESTRRLFGVISQANYFFAKSLRKNLTYAKTDASDEELLEALHTAELDEWYISLPDGLDTWLGEQAARMSGGEAQRLAVARVLLQDTPFVLLDEPTSNLDPETENKLLTTLFRVFSDKGVLMITHRLIKLGEVDKILFLVDGRIVETGKHSELLVQNGVYSHYWKLQQDLLLD
jgi:ABC-type transport system involved in cytochrome bd biosynthesis fused ATPase/permease subunit